MFDVFLSYVCRCGCDDRVILKFQTEKRNRAIRKIISHLLTNYEHFYELVCPLCSCCIWLTRSFKNNRSIDDCFIWLIMRHKRTISQWWFYCLNVAPVKPKQKRHSQCAGFSFVGWHTERGNSMQNSLANEVARPAASVVSPLKDCLAPPSKHKLPRSPSVQVQHIQ